MKIEYAINRYAMEVKRQLDVLDRHLAENEFMAGSEYTIADMAIWPWYGRLAQNAATTDAGAFLSERTMSMSSAGPPRSRRVRRSSAAPWSTRPRARRRSSCIERHDASDFETKTQDKLPSA